MSDKAKNGSQKKSRKLTPKQEAFAEHYLQNGFNGVQAAKKAGYNGSYGTLKSTARDNLQNPAIASRVRARIEGLAANANEVLHLLGDHLRGSIADYKDCFNEDGSFNLAMAEAKGVAQNIKRLRNVRRVIPRGKDEPPITEITVDIEMYSSQDAAAKLIPVLGLKQKPGENERDEERRRKWAEEQLAKVMERLGLDRDAAIAWMRANAPTAAQWIN